MKVEMVTDVIGAEVSGLDLSEPLAPETVLALDRALAEHGVLFFRDQHITPRQQLDFGGHFGELHFHPYSPNLGGDLQQVILLDSANYGPTGERRLSWHADATFEPRPPRGSILHAVEVPPVGGDTLWASLYAAYDSLSSRFQRMIDDLEAVHDSTMPFGDRAKERAAREGTTLEMKTCVHPVVTVHPVTGRKTIFVNRAFTTHIVGLSPTESSRILDLLYQSADVPDFTCRLRWEPGTVAMWDNRCTYHHAVGGYSGRRVMHRVTFLGPEPKR